MARTPASGEHSRAEHPLQRLTSSLGAMQLRHRQRHTPTGFGFALADRIDYFDPARWDAVTAGASVFLERSVLRAIEAFGPHNVQPRYALIFRGDRPVAAIAAQIVTVDAERLHREKPSDAESAGSSIRRALKQAFSPAVRATTGRWRERMLVAGNLLAWGFHGIAFSADEDPAELWPAVAEALYRLRRADRLTGETDLVMVKDLTSAHLGAEALRTFSYRPLETEPDMVLAIDPAWTRYEDYVAALDAKYRRKVRDQAKKLAAAGCTVESLADPGAHADRLHALYLAVQANAAVRLVTVPAGYLPALATALARGDRFRCTVIRREGVIVGFVTSVRDGANAIGYYIGFDRALAAEGVPLYLSLLHATIADAIAWKCSRLSLGRTALEPKAGLGAKPEPLTVWMRHRVPAVNWLLRGLLGAVPHTEAPERSPFKSPAAASFAPPGEGVSG